MALVSYLAIEIFPVPQSSCTSECLVDVARRIGFPGMHQAGNRMIGEWCHQNMDMIGHDAPGMDSAPFAVEEKYCLLDDATDLRLGKEGFPEALIEVVFETPTRFQGSLAFGKSREVSKAFFDDGPRQRISKPKTNGLGSLACFPVWNIASGVPHREGMHVVS